MRFAAIFKKNRDEKTYLFGTNSKRNRAMDMRDPIAWVKKFIPESVASKEELDTLTAKSFKLGFRPLRS